MLKLINASEMPPMCVLEYKCSYKEDKIEREIVDLIDRDYKEYLFLSKQMLVFYLVNDNKPNYILGDITIKNIPGVDYHNDRDSGQIGYAIRKSERGKGYGTLMLDLALKECAKTDMEEVSISCLQSNIASERVILANGGVLDKEWIDEDTGEKANKYWINLEKEKVKTKLYKE